MITNLSMRIIENVVWFQKFPSSNLTVLRTSYLVTESLVYRLQLTSVHYDKPTVAENQTRQKKKKRKDKPGSSMGNHPSIIGPSSQVQIHDASL